MNIRATLVELWSRAINYNTSEKVYYNGYNNLYPNEMERVVQNSPTAQKGASIMSKYVAGKGLSKDYIFDKKKLSSITKDIADDIAIHNGSFIHIRYGFDDELKNIIPISLKVLDYTKCRKMKTDDAENKGKIVYKDFAKRLMWGEKNVQKEYYPYSDDQEVILSQIKKDAERLLKANPDATIDEMLPHYTGQVYYLNLTPRYEYAISHLNAVYNDCDTEYRIGIYQNSSVRSGFLGKLAVLVSGLDEETTETIQNDVSNWLGSENSSNVFFMEIEDAENLDENFKIINIPTQYDEGQFKDTQQAIRTNIISAFGVPMSLVYSNDNGLFGNSGELIKQLKLYYTEQTEGERNAIEEFYRLIGFDTEILPLYTLDKEIEDET